PLVDRVTTFKPHQRRDFSLTRRAPNVGSGSRQHPRFRMLLREGAHCRNLVVGTLDALRATAAKQLRLDPDREKLRIKPAGFRAHRVEMAVAELLLDIDVLVEQTLRC